MSALFKTLFLLLAAIVLVQSKGCGAQCSDNSIPCGDACIAKDKTCHQTHGSACYPKKKCRVVCNKGKPCGDACIAKDATCKKTHGSACWEDAKDEL